MKVSGLMINDMDTVMKNSLIKMSTMVHTNSESPMARECTPGQMERSMTESGKTVRKMAMEFGAAKMATPTLASGLRGKLRDTASMFGKTKTSTRVNGTRTYATATVAIFSTTVTNSWANMFLASLRVSVSTNGKMAAPTWVISRMG